MRYTECEVVLYWERVLQDYTDPSVSVVADNFSDLFISDPVDPKTEVRNG